MARLDATELVEAERLFESFPIEVSECRASPKQLSFQAAFFERADDTGRRCDIFAAVGGNRSGKSYVTGWLCFAKYLRDHARSGDWFWCIGQTLERSIGGQQQELWKALPRWMFGDQSWDPKGGFAGGHHGKITLPTSDGGECLVEFRSADQDPSTFEQAKLRGIWADERLPESIYNRVLARIVDLRGFILYSDIPEQWWQFERLKESVPEAGVYWQGFEMADNAHNLPKGAIDTASARMTDDEKKLRIKGEFVVMEGVVYKEYRDLHEPDGHLTRPFPAGVPDDWPRWRLIDYGGSAPTACLWGTIAPTERAYWYREFYERNSSVYKAAKAIHVGSGASFQEVERQPDEIHRTPWTQFIVTGGEIYIATYIDPAAFDRSPANEVSIAQQYADYGIKCIPWPRVNQMGEHAMVQRVKFRYENDNVRVYDTLTNFRREKRSWKYKLDKDGKPVAADAFENANNHLLDCEKGFFGTNPTSVPSVCEVGSGE